MRIIHINSPKYGCKEVMVDDCDYESLIRFNWTLSFARKKSDSHMHKNLYADTRGFGHKKISMHRFIIGVSDFKVKIDHIDGNGLNNQRSNLRLCSHSQNLHNTGPSKSNKSGFKGVCFNKHVNKYMVQIMVNRKRISGGFFSDPVMAAKEWNRLSREHHGEFAYQNQV